MAGVVDYEAVEGFEHPSGKVQLWVYDTCIQRYKGLHQWMAFVDVDEYFIITDDKITLLPDLLKEYEEYGALVANWQVCAAATRQCIPLQECHNCMHVMCNSGLWASSSSTGRAACLSRHAHNPY